MKTAADFSPHQANVEQKEAFYRKKKCIFADNNYAE
jgi:hypothetical protein